MTMFAEHTTKSILMESFSLLVIEMASRNVWFVELHCQLEEF
jgi:hypothetical protein